MIIARKVQDILHPNGMIVFFFFFKSNKLLELIREFIEFVNTLSHYRNKDYDVGVI